MVAEPPTGWACVLQSFQGVDTVEEMAARALSKVAEHQGLPARARAAAKQFLVTVSPSATYGGITYRLGFQWRDDPVLALETALHGVSRSLRGRRLLLAWDEVPDMVLDVCRNQGPEAAVRLLGKLRSFRDDPDTSAVRWLMTGSVGFHHALRELRRGDALLNDLDPFVLGPLDLAWSRWLIESLLLGAAISGADDVIEAASEVTGGIPFLAHLLVSGARNEGLSSLVAAQVEPLFDRIASDLDQSQQATHLLSRIDVYYREHAPLAFWILDRLIEQPATHPGLAATAVKAGLVDTAESFREVTGWLQQDHYLTMSEGRLRWRYPALGRVWKLRRGNS